MKKVSLLAAGMAIMLGACTADAAININFTRNPGTGATAGFDIIRLFATIPVGDPSAGTALNSDNQPVSGLQSVDATLQVIGGSGLAFRFVSNLGGFGDIVTDFSNVGNPRVNNAATLGALGTGLRVGTTASQFFAVGTDPTPAVGTYGVDPNDPNAFVRTGPKPEVVFGLQGVPSDDTSQAYIDSFNKTYLGTTKTFRVKGTNPDHPDPAAINDSNAPGTGALFAVAVVPTGANVRLFSTDAGLAGKTGPIQPVDFTTVPEPASLTLLGIAGMAFLGRRRRHA